MPEEELSIEVRKIYGVQVHDVNLAESSEGEVLEQLTSDTTGTDHQDTRLLLLAKVFSKRFDQAHLLDAAVKCAERLLGVAISPHGVGCRGCVTGRVSMMVREE